MMDTNRDRNLLFGILAVQLRGVQPAQLVEAAAAWAVDPSRSLAERMVDKGLIGEADRELLERLVEDAVRAHGGSVALVVETFGGQEYLSKTCFGHTDDLDKIKTSPMDSVTFFSGTGREISGVSETPGRYSLVSHHARGGMGRVLVVHDEYLGRNIALKELLPPGAPEAEPSKPSPVRHSASLVARFLQEARITSQLEHPAIVPVYELGRRQDGSLYYTMRLVRGKTFAAALRECGGVEQRLRLLSNFISLCQAMAYAHSRGVIHRDIKPANVMLGQFGETVVLDWGLAKVRDNEDVHMEDIRDTLHFLDIDQEKALPDTAYGRALGTPHYMPPEQAEGRIDDINERSDVYSLGAVLYEILTGAPPHSGKTTREILESVISLPPKPVLEAAPDAPPELAVICEKALCKDPAGRYQSAVELAEEVQRFVDGSLVRAYRYSLRQVLAHYYGKHRALVNLSLAFAALLLVVAVSSYVSILNARDREHAQRLAAEEARRMEAEARGAAERQAYLAQIHLAQARLKEGDTIRAAEALWAAPPKERGWEWGCLLNQVEPGILTVETPESTIFAAVFSPDGARIGTNTHPLPPAVYDTATGGQLALMEAEPQVYLDTVFSPDGARYMGVSEEGLASVWDAATGKRLHRIGLGAPGKACAFDATGKRIFIGTGDGRICAYDSGTGARLMEAKLSDAPVARVLPLPGRDRLLVETTGEALLRLWDSAAGACLWTAPGTEAELSADGARAAACRDADIVLLDTENGAELGVLRGHEKGVFSMHFNRDASRLISASMDGTAILWNTGGAAPLHRFGTPGGTPVIHAFLLQRDALVFSVDGMNKCRLYDTATGAMLRVFDARETGVNRAEAHPAGQWVLLASGGHSFQLVNAAAPAGVQCLVANPAPGNPLRDIAASSDGRILAVTQDSAEAGVFVVDTVEKRAATAFAASFGGFAQKPALSADGARMIMPAGRFTPVVVDNPAAAPKFTPFSGHDAPVSAVAIKLDGSTAASGDDSGGLCLWNAATGAMEQRLDAHKGVVSALSFSPDGKRLLSAGFDGELVFRNAATGEKEGELPRQEGGVAAACFSPDGKRAAAVTTFGVIRMWDAAAGAELGTARIDAFNGRADEYAAAGYAIRFWHDGGLLYARSPLGTGVLRDAGTMDSLAWFDYEAWVAPLSGGRYAAAGLGGGLAVIAPPAETADLAAFDADRHRQYQLEWAENTAFADAPAPPLWVLAGREELAGALSELAGALRAAPDSAGLSVPQCRAAGVLLLKPGDLLRELDGVAAAEPSVLETAAARLNGGTETATLLLIRNGREQRVHYWTRPVERTERAVTLARADALGLVEYALDAVPAARSALPNDAAWTYFSMPQDSPLLAKTGLFREELLVAVDGVPVAGPAALEQSLLRLRESVTAGTVSAFSLTVKRGPFRETVYDVKVEQ